MVLLCWSGLQTHGGRILCLKGADHLSLSAPRPCLLQNWEIFATADGRSPPDATGCSPPKERPHRADPLRERGVNPCGRGVGRGRGTPVPLPSPRPSRPLACVWDGHISTLFSALHASWPFPVVAP